MAIVLDRDISPERIAALAALLDDETTAVENALLKEFRQMEEGGLALLRKWARMENSHLCNRAKYFLERLGATHPSEDFVQYIRGQKYDLETGLFLLNRVVSAHLQPEHLWPQLDAIARRCRDLISEPATPFAKIKVINRVLFHELGFRGDVENYDDPMNSFIEPVLRRRKGIPITLCLIYILLARRLHLELDPIGMPGRFLIGCYLEPDPFYIDAFERGTIRTESEVREILRSNQIFPENVYLMPTTTPEILCRCCRNLVRQYQSKNHPAWAKIFASFVREFEDILRQTRK